MKGLGLYEGFGTLLRVWDFMKGLGLYEGVGPYEGFEII